MEYAKLKDGELRGVLLRALYERRRETNRVFPRDGAVEVQDPSVLLVEGIPKKEQDRLLFHLIDVGLVDHIPIRSIAGPRLLAVWISSSGIDVVEGNRPAPIAITIHATNAQVGDGNTLHHT